MHFIRNDDARRHSLFSGCEQEKLSLAETALRLRCEFTDLFSLLKYTTLCIEYYVHGLKFIKFYFILCFCINFF